MTSAGRVDRGAPRPALAEMGGPVSLYPWSSIWTSFSSLPFFQPVQMDILTKKSLNHSSLNHSPVSMFFILKEDRVRVLEFLKIQRSDYLMVESQVGGVEILWSFLCNSKHKKTV